MSEIVKTKAVVLRKISYGDTSEISSLFSEELGKISCIVKGAKSSKSTIGTQIDLLNLVEIVLYKKESREVQLITQSSILEPFNKLKEDLECLKYASGIIELTNTLTVESEANQRIFAGLVKILRLLNDCANQPKVYFVKYFLFILKEVGYGIDLGSCSQCKKKLPDKKQVIYNLEYGLICSDCSEGNLSFYEFPAELFEIFSCLSGKQKCDTRDADLEKIISFLEKFLSYQMDEFKGLNSLRMY